ncbi:DUF4192 family protein [Rothia uropygioeca]|uniref:DUF4192 family protein n=1 Tax=Kocuria sp. 257 TaxID=2021970 RepID=UPI0010137DAC|nr:hypothetical protein [Kocuria sp. 257]
MNNSRMSRTEPSPMGTAAKDPEDVLAYMPYALGYWPQESLLLASASESYLGPCLRIDLPTSLSTVPEWTAALPPVVETLAFRTENKRVFAAAFTGHTASLEVTAPRDGSAVEASSYFVCGRVVMAALAQAMAVSSRFGLRGETTWVVDRAHDRWGTLLPFDDTVEASSAHRIDSVDPRRPAREVVAVPGPAWPVLRGGNIRTILASPLGAALVFQGHVVRDAGTAVMDDRRLPGFWELASVLGASAAASMRRQFDEVVSHERSHGCPGIYEVSRLIGRLAAQFERKRDARAAAVECTKTLSAGECVAVAAWMDKPIGIYVLLTCAAAGPGAARRLTDRTAGGAHADTASDMSDGVALMTGRREEEISVPRVQALRVLLNAVEQLGTTEMSDCASVANAYVSWFFGLNSQAGRYLQRVRTYPGKAHAALLHAVMDNRPLPRWLGRYQEG